MRVLLQSLLLILIASVPAVFTGAALAHAQRMVVNGQIVEVPNVVGLSYEQAKKRLNDRGLQVGNVEPGYCYQYVGAVCRQNPQAGRKVDITEPVHLIVSRGPKR